MILGLTIILYIFICTVFGIGVYHSWYLIKHSFGKGKTKNYKDYSDIEEEDNLNDIQLETPITETHSIVDEETGEELYKVSTPMLPDEKIENYLNRLPAAELRKIVKDYKKDGHNIEYPIVKFIKPTVTDEELKGKRYISNIDDMMNMVVLDLCNIPINYKLPKELFFVIVEKFGTVDAEGDIDFSEPIKYSVIMDFIKENDIVIGGFNFGAQNYKYEPKSVSSDKLFTILSNNNEITKPINLDKDVMILQNESLNVSIQNTINEKDEVFVISYEDNNKIFKKFTKNIEVYRHYKNTFPYTTDKSMGELKLPSVGQFIEWYDQATYDIMKLDDQVANGIYEI